METDVRDPMILKGGVNGNGRESPKTVLLEAREEEDMETYSLLAPETGGMAREEEDMETYSLLAPETGGMARNGEKKRLSVQWNDANGNKLAEVLEFQPSDASDSEEDESDACPCCIM